MDIKNSTVNNRGIAVIPICEYTQDIAIGVKDAFTLPADIEIINLWVETATALTEVDLTFDILESSVSILTSPIRVNVGSTSSKTASPTYLLKKNILSKDKVVSLQVLTTDTTVPCKGLKLFIECYAFNQDLVYNFISFGSVGSMTVASAGKANISGDTFTGQVNVPTLATTNAVTGVTLTGNTLSADGTATDIDINLTAKGAGSIVPNRLILPTATASNGQQAEFSMSVISRPDDYVANVQSSATIDVASQPNINIQSTGTVTVTGTPVADETLTVYDQVFAFKATRAGVGEITISANTTTQATNIAAAITLDVAEVTAVASTNTVLITAVKTAPFVGAGGDVIVFAEAATGIVVTGDGGLTGGQNADTLGIAGTTYTFIANGATPGVGEIALGATTIATAESIAAISHSPSVELTTFGTNVIITATAAGTSGDGISYITDGTRITNSGAPLETSGGVDEVKSYLNINGIEYIFAVDTGDDPADEYPTSSPVITTVGATMPEIADALVVAMKLDTNTFSNTSVVANSENIIAKYKDEGVIGNSATYANNLVVAGDITDSGIVGGFFTGGLDGDVGPVGQVRVSGGVLYISNGTDWVSYTTAKPKTYQTVSSEQGILDVNEGVNCKITLTNDTLLTLTNLTSGDEGNIIVVQDAANYTLALSPAPSVVNNGQGVTAITAGAGSVTRLSYTYDGTDLYVTVDPNYTKA